MSMTRMVILRTLSPHGVHLLLVVAAFFLWIVLVDLASAARAQLDAMVSMALGSPEKAADLMPFKKKRTDHTHSNQGKGPSGLIPRCLRLLRGTSPDEPQGDAPLGHPDRIMLRLGEHDTLSFSEARSILVLGASGVGKTTCTGTALGMAILSNQHGVLVQAAKDDLKRWWAMTYWSGRSKDWIEFNESSCFNFLEYIVQHAQHPSTDVTEVLSLACELVSPHAARGSKDPFWSQARDRMIRTAVDLLLLADETVSVEQIQRISVTAPHSTEEARDPAWVESSFCGQCITSAAKNATDENTDAVRRAIEYWAVEFAGLAASTRASIQHCFTAAADTLLRPPLLSMFSGAASSVTPTDVLAGRVVYLNHPTLIHGRTGSLAQGIWRACLQLAILRRYAPQRGGVTIVADEAQEHANEQDTKFLSVCREYNASLVFLTQNVDALAARMGGREQADALLSGFQSCFFMQNTSPATNEFASRLVGSDWVTKASYSLGNKDASPQNPLQQQQPTMGSQFSQQFAAILPPIAFASLRTGSPEHGNIAECIVVVAGKSWSAGKPYSRARFERIDFH